jgi:hypothetical protein
MNAPANIDSATLHSIELEQEILGAVLVNNSVFDVIESKLTASDFFEPLHSEIFDAIAKVRASHGVVTPALIIASIGGEPVPVARDPRSFTDGDWQKRLTYFQDSQTWLEAWGPKPGEPGCLVPSHLLLTPVSSAKGAA